LKTALAWLRGERAAAIKAGPANAAVVGGEAAGREDLEAQAASRCYASSKSLFWIASLRNDEKRPHFWPWYQFRLTHPQASLRAERRV